MMDRRMDGRTDRRTGRIDGTDGFALKLKPLWMTDGQTNGMDKTDGRDGPTLVQARFYGWDSVAGVGLDGLDGRKGGKRGNTRKAEQSYRPTDGRKTVS